MEEHSAQESPERTRTQQTKQEPADTIVVPPAQLDRITLRLRLPGQPRAYGLSITSYVMST